MALANVFKVFSAMVMFWALFDQHSSSWVLQARDLNLQVGSLKLEASQMQVLNPLFVMLMIPVMQYILYPLVGALGVEVTPLRCMSVGMFVASASFFFVFCIQLALDAGHRPSVLWQVPAAIMLTLSELLVSVTSLEFAYMQAPPSMKATMMSFLMLTIFAGNALDALISIVNIFEGAQYFLFYAALMLGTAVAFIWIAASFRVQAFRSDEGTELVAAKQRQSDDEQDAKESPTARS